MQSMGWEQYILLLKCGWENKSRPQMVIIIRPFLHWISKPIYPYKLQPSTGSQLFRWFEKQFEEDYIDSLFYKIGLWVWISYCCNLLKSALCLDRSWLEASSTRIYRKRSDIPRGAIMHNSLSVCDSQIVFCYSNETIYLTTLHLPQNGRLPSISGTGVWQ